MKNLIGIFLIAAIAAVGLYGLHTYNQKKEREAQLEIARLEQQKLEEERRREEALKKAEQAKCFQANLAIAKKALRRINVRRYNTPVKELVKFQQYIELLNPPEDILSLAQDLPKIAAAIRMPYCPSLVSNFSVMMPSTGAVMAIASRSVLRDGDFPSP